MRVYGWLPLLLALRTVIRDQRMYLPPWTPVDDMEALAEDAAAAAAAAAKKQAPGSKKRKAGSEDGEDGEQLTPAASEQLVQLEEEQVR